jgi:predicted DCC family thiol-disulfide oxidoreductase YuxK
VNASLYYDGNCPLCSKEIAVLKHLTSEHIDFIDIHQTNDPQLPSKDILLQRLHLRKSNGDWLLGLDATAYAWAHTPYRMLFTLLRTWPFRSIADFAYTYWADQRFKKRYQCKTC